MTRSSASTTGGRSSGGSTSPRQTRMIRAGGSRCGGCNPESTFSPWVLGFRGHRIPAGFREAASGGSLAGIILFRDNLGGSLESARSLVTELQRAAPKGQPLLFLADEEGGLISQTTGLQLPEGGEWQAVPTPRALGRSARPADLRWIGALLGRRLRSLGIRLSVAPCLDLDTEGKNPVIGTRSFGSDPVRVAEFGLAFARGLADAGVGCVFKHYPGHGGTVLDSHLDLPRMDPAGLEMHEKPFRLALKKASALRAAFLMPAHVDWGSGLAASLDPDLLSRPRRILPGVPIVTDALDMGAVSLDEGAGEVALLAGNDLLLVGREWEAGLRAVAALKERSLEDPLLRKALARAGKNLEPAWGRLAAAGSRGLRADPAGEDSSRLRRLHVRALSADRSPDELAEGEWVWLVPEGLPPYVRLQGWTPPAGRRRACGEVIWIPGRASRSWASGIARRLRTDPRPVLLVTLWRGAPTEDVREVWSPLLELPRLTAIAHLLDEIWPGPGAYATFRTSGPSRDALDALAMGLGAPAGSWREGPQLRHSPVDRWVANLA